jgi:RNA polymerase sigma factor (sigma-70 family)
VVRLPPFQGLLDEHADAIHRYLLAAAGPVDAPDCFQETFLAALRAYPSLRSAHNLRGWLFTIARNKAIDAHRTRARRPLPVERLPDGMDLADVEVEHPVWEAVHRLPERQRDTVLLRYGADLAYADVGRLLGISEEAARQHASTAVRALRQRRRRRNGGWDDDDS